MPEIQPPEDDELFEETDDGLDEQLTAAINASRERHAHIDQMKRESVEGAAELRGLAKAIELDGDSETAEAAREIAAIVQTVADRIEEGDIHRVRQP